MTYYIVTISEYARSKRQFKILGKGKWMDAIFRSCTILNPRWLRWKGLPLVIEDDACWIATKWFNVIKSSLLNLTSNFVNLWTSNGYNAECGQDFHWYTHCVFLILNQMIPMPIKISGLPEHCSIFHFPSVRLSVRHQLHQSSTAKCSPVQPRCSPVNFSIAYYPH